MTFNTMKFNTTAEMIIAAEEEAFNLPDEDEDRFNTLQQELNQSPFLDLTMADHFALHALGIDWDALDTRDAQQ